MKLGTSIQASFGNPEDPDYVFEIAANSDKSTMAVSLSTNAIKLYSPETGAYLGDCLGHEGTISKISFPDPDSPMLLLSSSADGTVRTWDIRQRSQVCTFNHPTAGGEVWDFGVGGITNHVAGGGDGQVFIWDFKNRKLVASLDYLHTEAVTQFVRVRAVNFHDWESVHFHPVKRYLLYTASVDGLINCVDTSQPMTGEDVSLKTVSVGTSIGKIGFYGRSTQLIWCLTYIETLSVWDVEDFSPVADFKDTRTHATFKWNLPDVKYLLDCHSPTGTDDLWLAAGNNDGATGFFPASFTRPSHSGLPSVGTLGEVGCILDGGHQSVVRTIWLSQNMDSKESLFAWTGGEDGRLCSWSQSSTEEYGRSWVSKKLIAKKGHTARTRHYPY